MNINTATKEEITQLDNQILLEWLVQKGINYKLSGKYEGYNQSLNYYF